MTCIHSQMRAYKHVHAQKYIHTRIDAEETDFLSEMVSIPTCIDTHVYTCVCTHTHTYIHRDLQMTDRLQQIILFIRAVWQTLLDVVFYSGQTRRPRLICICIRTQSWRICGVPQMKLLNNTKLRSVFLFSGLNTRGVMYLYMAALVGIRKLNIVCLYPWTDYLMPGKYKSAYNRIMITTCHVNIDVPITMH